MSAAAGLIAWWECQVHLVRCLTGGKSVSEALGALEALERDLRERRSKKYTLARSDHSDLSAVVPALRSLRVVGSSAPEGFVFPSVSTSKATARAPSRL